VRLVFVTQTVDAEDPVLGATVAKLKALAARCDELVVLTDRTGLHDLPPNCVIRTFGAPTRIGRGVRYLRALVPLLASRRPPDALIAHMCPIYLVLAAPFTKVRRVPTILWYTHWAVHRTLRLATALADVALSVDRRSFPLDLPKVSGIGHGIDVTQFAARTERSPNGGAPLRLLAFGRTSPTKAFDTSIRAVAQLRKEGVALTLDIYGPSWTEEEHQHRRKLLQLIEEEGVGDAVRLLDPVSRVEVPELMRSADAVVNTTLGLTSTGGALDKVVYESAASGVPVLASNPNFDEFLGDLPVELRFRSADSDDLARVIGAFARAEPARREETGRELRRRVETGHSVDSWADAVVATVQRLKS
jgi:glycosyltransferase involved in cell wall biosynthesis